MTPPAPIAQILDTPPTPTPSVNPRRDTIALLGRANLPPISELAEPSLNLAGYRINPRNNGPANSRIAWLNGLSFQPVSGGRGARRGAPGQRPLHLAGLVARRNAARLPDGRAARPRPLGGGRGERPGAPGRRQRQRRLRRRLRLAAGQLGPAGAYGPRRPRGGSHGRARALRSDRAGERRPLGPRPHLPGPAAQQHRRGPVRPLLHLPAGAGEPERRRCAQRRAPWPLLGLQRLAGRPLPAADPRQAAVQLRGAVGPVPHRDHRHRPAGERGAPCGRPAAARRHPFAVRRRGARPPLRAVAGGQARHAGLGRGAGRRRRPPSGRVPRPRVHARRALHRRAGEAGRPEGPLRRRRVGPRRLRHRDLPLVEHAAGDAGGGEPLPAGDRAACCSSATTRTATTTRAPR
jgi:hypothetical protein